MEQKLENAQAILVQSSMHAQCGHINAETIVKGEGWKQ